MQHWIINKSVLMQKIVDKVCKISEIKFLSTRLNFLLSWEVKKIFQFRKVNRFQLSNSEKLLSIESIWCAFECMKKFCTGVVRILVHWFLYGSVGPIHHIVQKYYGLFLFFIFDYASNCILLFAEISDDTTMSSFVVKLCIYSYQESKEKNTVVYCFCLMNISSIAGSCCIVEEWWPNYLLNPSKHFLLNQINSCNENR